MGLTRRGRKLSGSCPAPEAGWRACCWKTCSCAWAGRANRWGGERLTGSRWWAAGCAAVRRGWLGSARLGLGGAGLGGWWWLVAGGGCVGWVRLAGGWVLGAAGLGGVG